jgi:hypothetical protein
MFEERASKIFGSKGKKVTAGRRTLHNDGFRNLYSPPPNIIRTITSRRMWLGERGDVTTGSKEMRKAYNVLVGKSEGKKQHTRSRSRREGNINISLEGIWFCSICLGCRLVGGFCKRGNESSDFIKCGKFDSLSEYYFFWHSVSYS